MARTEYSIEEKVEILKEVMYPKWDWEGLKNFRKRFWGEDETN